MPFKKNIKAVNPGKLKYKLSGIEYVCSQEVLRKLITNLAKMEYSNEKTRLEFYKQFEIIMSILWNKIEFIRSMDPYLYTTYKLLHFLSPERCINQRLKITFYNYDSVNRSYIFQNQPFILAKIKDCKIDTVVIPMELMSVNFIKWQINPSDILPIHSKHSNLIILNKYSKLAWRIEPNAGTEFDIYNKIIDTHLKNYLNILGYKYLYDFPGECPYWINKLPGYITKHLPINPGKPMKYIPHNGLCIFLAVGKFAYGNNLTDSILKDFTVKFFKSEIKEICAK